MNALLRWYYTVRPLKAAQWWYRVWRAVAMQVARRRKTSEQDIAVALKWPMTALASSNVRRSYFPVEHRFCFLNRSHTFPQKIDWDWRDEGLLWTYNLNYFEWLYDDKLTIQERLETMQLFVAAKQHAANDAYPSSLRIVSWIRFLLRFVIKDERILNRLFSDADWLCRFPEYQLDGNHLWENAVAILCAGIYFRNKRFHKKGSELLRSCIQEQILPGGGHIEGSPMYHSLLLWRLMQLLEIFRALNTADKELENLLMDTSSKMLGWLQAMTFSDGTWPHFNDSADGVAPTTAELSRYANALGIPAHQTTLYASGYRMIGCSDFELAIDVAPVRPQFQPGHTHADIGTFCLHYKGAPVLVDTGTSTYEQTKRRTAERGTAAHNTITVGVKNSSEIWKSFRVGRRAKLLAVNEGENSLSVAYAPFAHPNTVHKRTFIWSESGISIYDEVHNGAEQNEARLHFHPDVAVLPQGNNKFMAAGLTFTVDGFDELKISNYDFAAGFNQILPAISAGFWFKTHLKLNIQMTPPANKLFTSSM